MLFGTILFAVCANAAESSPYSTIRDPMCFKWNKGPERFNQNLRGLQERVDEHAHVWGWKDTAILKRLGLKNIDDLNYTDHNNRSDRPWTHDGEIVKSVWKDIIRDMINTATGRQLSTEDMKIGTRGGNFRYNDTGSGSVFNAYHRDNYVERETETYRINIYLTGGEKLQIGSNTIVSDDPTQIPPAGELDITSKLIGDGPDRYHQNTSGFGGHQVDAGFRPRQTLDVDLTETPVVMWADGEVVHSGVPSANYRKWIDITVTIPRQ